MYHKSKHRRIYYLPPRETMKKIQLATAIEGFMIACQARGLSLHTIDDYRRTCKMLIAHVGNAQITDITSVQISAFLASRSTLVGKKTILNYHIGMSALWTWALREKFVTENIIRNVEKPKPQKHAISPFTEVEIRLRAVVARVLFSDAGRASALHHI